MVFKAEAEKADAEAKVAETRATKDAARAAAMLVVLQEAKAKAVSHKNEAQLEARKRAQAAMAAPEGEVKVAEVLEAAVAASVVSTAVVRSEAAAGAQVRICLYALTKPINFCRRGCPF